MQYTCTKLYEKTNYVHFVKVSLNIGGAGNIYKYQ